MKRYKGIDYSFRPASYWDDNEILTSLLRDVKGTERRRLIRQHWEHGTLEQLPEALLQTELSPELRVFLGRVHPALMGGEYLPEYDPAETEIARLELRSTTADVVSIRAFPLGEEIGYRIVDEYGEKFELERESSARPFSLRELVRFIDGSSHPEACSGLALGYNDICLNCGTDLESLRFFTSVDSDIYPQLSRHYDCVFEDWYQENLAEQEPEPVEEEEAKDKEETGADAEVPEGGNA
jgi:hypothetical protein